MEAIHNKGNNGDFPYIDYNIYTPQFKCLLFFLAMAFLNPQVLFPGLSWLRIPFVAALIALIALILSKPHQPLIPKAIQNKIIFLFLILISFSLTQTSFDVPFSNRKYVYMELFKILIFYAMVIAIIENKYQLKSFIWFLIIAISLDAIISLITMKLGLNRFFTQEGWRLQSFFGNGASNDWAMHLLAVLPLSINLVDVEKKRGKKLILYICTMILITTILRTRSRMGILGLFIAAAMLLWGRRRDMKTLIALLIIGIALCLHAHPRTWERFITIDDVARQEIDINSGSRKNKWLQAIELTKRHPFTGVGIGNFSQAVRKYELGEWEHIQHNTYLQLASEAGIPTAAVFIILILISLKHIWSAETYFKRRNMPDMFNIANSIKISLLTICFCMIFLNQHSSRFFYIMIALTVIINKLKHRDSSRPLHTRPMAAHNI